VGDGVDHAVEAIDRALQGRDRRHLGGADGDVAVATGAGRGESARRQGEND
jgi:hypothetical protein